MTPLELTLASGRKITLEELVQCRTYAGLLAGYPTRPLNRRRVERAIERARESLIGTPLLIEPVETDCGAPTGADEPRVELPPITCIGSFRSDAPARDLEEVDSYLTVVWFQPEWALPIDAAIIHRIEAVDWELLATDATD